MSALLGVLIIIILAVPIAFLLKRRIEDTFFAAFSVVSLVLYIFGVAGHLMAGVYTVCALAIIGITVLLSCVFISKSNKSASVERIKKYVLTSGLFVFIFLGIFFAILNIGRMYYLNDEFSHWGLAIKNMFALDSLAVVPESSATFKDYPPFATLVCYFFSAVTGSYNESMTFTGMALLMFSCLMPLFNIFAKKDRDDIQEKFPGKYVFVPLAVSVCFIFVMVFKLSAFTILAVDTLLGLIPVYILSIYYSARKQREKSMCSFAPWILICIAMFSLVLTKGTGFSFAIYAGAIIFIDMIFFCREQCGADVYDSCKSIKTKLWYRAICGIIPLYTAWVTKMSWSAVLNANNVKDDSVGLSETLKRAYNLTINRRVLMLWQQNTVNNFIKATFEGRFSVGVSLAFIVMLLVAFSVILIILVRKDRSQSKSYAWLFAGTFMGFFIYMLGILYIYVYAFTQYEGETLASYERYTGTYLTMWLCLLLVLYAYEFFDKFLLKLKNEKFVWNCVAITSVISIACVVVFFFGFYPYTAKKSVKHRQVYDADTVIGETYEKIKKDATLPSNVKICYLTLKEENRELYIANYYAAPFTLDFSKKLPSNIAEYSYIYIDSAEPDEIAKMDKFLIEEGDCNSNNINDGSECKIKTGTLYKISFENNVPVFRKVYD